MTQSKTMVGLPLFFCSQRETERQREGERDSEREREMWALCKSDEIEFVSATVSTNYFCRNEIYHTNVLLLLVSLEAGEGSIENVGLYTDVQVTGGDWSRVCGMSRSNVPKCDIHVKFTTHLSTYKELVNLKLLKNSDF